jgi:anaerobic selenocysteine-containing dehydrogenase
MLIPHNKYVDDKGIRWTKSRCFFCHMNCAILVGVDTETETIVEIAPNDQHGTILCERVGDKGEKAIKFHYHPKRINHALKRIGERGEDRWEEIPYEQALDEIADKLKELAAEYGPETLCTSEGTYRCDHLWARSRFTNLFGNPSNIVDPGQICWTWTYTLNMSMVGWPVEASVPPTSTYANTGVLWGSRPTERYSQVSPIWRQLQIAMNRPPEEGPKAKLIVIDPVCHEACLSAEHWLRPHTGTDLIMMLAWVNYIIENELYDVDFLKDWSNGTFLCRKDTHLLIYADEFDAKASHEDYIVWNAETGKPAIWCSDKNSYYEDNVNPEYTGDFTVTLADGSTVECYTAFDAIKERMSEYTLDRAAEVCGVPATEIANACYTYATNKPSYINWGLGGGDMAGWNGAYSGVAKTMMRILTGNIDILGGEYIGEPGPLPTADGKKEFPFRDSEYELSEMVSPEARKKQIGYDKFRLMSWKGFEPGERNYRKMYGIPRPMLHQMLTAPSLVWKAVEEGDPYPITAMIAWSSNPLAWAPNTKHVYRALKKLKLFVVVDYWKTPTAALADYILPAADSLERPIAGTNEDGDFFTAFGDRGSVPVGDRHVDYDFWRGLGIRCGQEEYWPWEDYEGAVAYRVDRVPGWDYDRAIEEGIIIPSKIRFKKYEDILDNGEVRGFATKTRKAEIFPTLLQDLDYDPLPFYRDPYESPEGSPDLAKEYPLRLMTGGRFCPMYHSEMRVPGTGTRQMWPDPIMEINVTDARTAGIRDGDWCWVETPRGRIRQRARIVGTIKRGNVIVQSSWWFPELPAEEPWCQGIFESGANVLTTDDIESHDPITGQWPVRGLLCRVYPCINGRDKACDVIGVTEYALGDGEDFYSRSFGLLEKNSVVKKLDENKK